MDKKGFLLKQYYKVFIENIIIIWKLLYRKSILLLLGSVFFGVIGFCAEAGLAVALNGILVLIGLVEVDKLPNFLQSIAFSGRGLIFITCLFLLVRAITLFWKQMISGIIYWDFKRLYEQKLVTAAISDESNAPISGAYVSSMIATGIPRAGSVIRALSEVLLGVVLVIPLTASLIYLSPQLTVLGFTGIALVVFLSASLNRYVLEVGNQVNPIFNEFTERYLSSIRNRILLRIYGTTKSEIYECVKASQRFRSRMTAIVKWNSLVPVLSNFLVPVWLLFIIWIAITHLTILPGTILSFFYLFLRLGSYLSALSGNVSAILADLPAAQELARNRWISQDIPKLADSTIHGEEKPYYKSIREGSKNHSECVDTEIKGVQIEAINVGVDYSDNIIFSGVNFMLPAGDCLGIIGYSGSGKSTLIGVIAGLMPPAEGNVLIDNLVPGLDFFLTFRKHIGYVGPEPLLKQGTIYENLVYGLNEPVGEGKILKILEEIRLDEISRLGRNGLDWKIYEGGEGLSSGQKQRLCLVRALLRNPRLLILDEATANLDEQSEKYIIEYLQKLKGSMTMIIATHRQQPLTLSDQIIDLGRLSQQTNQNNSLYVSSF